MAILDTFDMLSPQYDNPASLKEFTSWFHELKMNSIDVHYGHNGIEGRGIK